MFKVVRKVILQFDVARVHFHRAVLEMNAVQVYNTSLALRMSCAWLSCVSGNVWKLDPAAYFKKLYAVP